MAVAAGSALGASLRLAVSMLTPAAWLGTLLVNVVGAALMGYAARYLLTAPRPRLQAFWLPGFCGGFTSLSSFSWEWLQLAHRIEAATPSGALLLLAALAGASAAWIGGAALGWWMAGRRAESACAHR
jgi:CrcB protein